MVMKVLCWIVENIKLVVAIVQIIITTTTTEITIQLLVQVSLYSS